MYSISISDTRTLEIVPQVLLIVLVLIFVYSGIPAILLIVINNTNSRYCGIPLITASSSNIINIRKGYGT